MAFKDSTDEKFQDQINGSKLNLIQFSASWCGPCQQLKPIIEKISNEISTTSGYEFNKKNSVLATSGNNKFKFDIKQQGFAWMTSNKKENIMVKVMKKGSRIMVTGYNEKGSQTIDHYSLLGFTKAYSTAKKACS